MEPPVKERARGKSSPTAPKPPAGGIHNLADRLASTAFGRFVGQLFYNLGYWAEYIALCTARGLRAGGVRTWQGTARVARRLGRFVWGGVRGVWAELTAPFRRFINGLRNIRALVREQKQQGRAHAAKEGLAYFGRGFKLYWPLVRRALAYVMPLLALGVFYYTVTTILDYQYVLAVEVEGNVVGYVENEMVFDAARNDLQTRIATAAANTDREWNITPSYSLAVRSMSVMSETSMTDAILRASGDEIQEATALYVDNELKAITTEGARLQQALDEMLAPYEQPDNENFRVEFDKDVELVDGIYFTDSISGYEQIDSLIHGQEQGEVYYTVQKNDTPGGIAARNNLTLDELVALNPEILEKLFVGDQVLVTQSRDFLPIKTVERRVYTEEIQYKTETTNSSDYSFGTTKVVQEGQNGTMQVTSDFVTVNGITTEQRIDETVLVEPVTRKVIKGTRLPNGQVGQVGSGVLSWPVPASSRLSRGFGGSHYGLDIIGPYATGIYAADDGVVTISGSGQTHWSYGICVKIDHGNGMQTMYAHMSQALVSRGSYVKRGQLIGLMGSTGCSTGTHLHFEVWVGGVRRNPYSYVAS